MGLISNPAQRVVGINQAFPEVVGNGHFEVANLMIISTDLAQRAALICIGNYRAFALVEQNGFREFLTFLAVAFGVAAPGHQPENEVRTIKLIGLKDSLTEKFYGINRSNSDLPTAAREVSDGAARNRSLLEANSVIATLLSGDNFAKQAALLKDMNLLFRTGFEAESSLGNLLKDLKDIGADNPISPIAPKIMDFLGGGLEFLDNLSPEHQRIANQEISKLFNRNSPPSPVVATSNSSVIDGAGRRGGSNRLLRTRPKSLTY